MRGRGTGKTGRRTGRRKTKSPFFPYAPSGNPVSLSFYLLFPRTAHAVARNPASCGVAACKIITRGLRLNTRALCAQYAQAAACNTRCFAAITKSVKPKNLKVTGSPLEPYGEDARGKIPVIPARFWRESSVVGFVLVFVLPFVMFLVFVRGDEKKESKKCSLLILSFNRNYF